MRSKVFRVAAIVGVAVVALLLVVLRPMGHKLTVRAHFANARGLSDGAPVRAAGVEVGSVRSVRVRPELKDGPVEVVMALNTRYEIRIPNDSVVSLETAGVLGGTYVEIEAAGTSGPPIGNDAVLKSRPEMSTEQFFENLNKVAERILEKSNCDCATPPDKTTPSPKSPGKSPAAK
jgi:phospholipid/cholesterol/gamma-HCH transport system substrate-binding protein